MYDMALNSLLTSWRAEALAPRDPQRKGIVGEPCESNSNLCSGETQIESLFLMISVLYDIYLYIYIYHFFSAANASVNMQHKFCMAIYFYIYKPFRNM